MIEFFLNTPTLEVIVTINQWSKPENLRDFNTDKTAFISFVERNISPFFIGRREEWWCRVANSQTSRSRQRNRRGTAGKWASTVDSCFNIRINYLPKSLVKKRTLQIFKSFFCFSDRSIKLYETIIKVLCSQFYILAIWCKMATLWN